MDTAIKALGQGRIGGYLVVFGSSRVKDLQGEYFSRETDFGLDWFDRRPALYQHGQDGVLKSQPIGVIESITQDEVGLWAEAQLDLRNQYVEHVVKLVERGALAWSSGSVPHLVKVKADGGIAKWPIVEGSLTPNPAEPRRTDVRTIKSAYDALGLEWPNLDEDVNNESEPETGGQVAKTSAVEPENVGRKAVPSIEPMEDSEMTEQNQAPAGMDADAIKSMMRDVMREEYASRQESEAAPKSGISTKASHPVSGATDDDSTGMKAFMSYMQTGQKNTGLKALQDGTDSEGGYLVPNDFYTSIIERGSSLSVVDTAPGFFRLTTSRNTYDIPVEASDPAAMTETAEEAAYTVADPAFGNAQGVIKKFTRRIVVSEELVNDTPVALEQFLTGRVAREWALARNTLLVTRMEAVATALTLDANTGVTAAEVPEIIGKQPEFYLDGSVWLMRWATENTIRSLQGNQFLFAPTPAGNAMGNRRDLWGYPVYNAGQVDAIGASAKPIFFFNPEFVAVIDNTQMTMLRDPYTNAANGQINMYFKARFDIVVLQAGAVQTIAMPGA